MSSTDTPATPPRASLMPWLMLTAAFGALLYLYWDGLALMVSWWEREEYSHGYMIPLVAGFMVWQKLNALPAASDGRLRWLGLLAVLGGLMALVLGEMSSLYTIIQYGFLLALYGLLLAFFGWGGMRLLWVPLAYLIFMIPLPNFLYNNLSSHLQLISSEIGVAVIRLFGISVYLEGNVIDLGAMQLQVVEACSGLRYLFPLMSFGFLIAYIYRGPVWFRTLLFLSTIPITVLMNSFRIGVIGVTVEHWGIEMAEGFLHDFEGWFVFMACVGILLLMILIYHVASGKRGSFWAYLDLDTPRLNIALADFTRPIARHLPLIGALVLVLATVPLAASVKDREEIIPPRTAFSSFPLFHAGWIGREQGLDADVLDTLKLTDYIQANYSNAVKPLPVNFYVAYYESQRKGASIHSPRSCLPGGGWRITSLQDYVIEGVTHPGGEPLVVNRAVIQKGDITQVAYYWFDGRSRNITNEYLAKWYLFWDGMNESRSDGALIRVITLVDDPTNIDKADAALGDFVRDFYPLMKDYVPS